MAKKQNIRSKSADENKSMPTEDITGRAARYNYSDMQKDTIDAKEGFAKRLSDLRMQKGTSAREMSLSLGEGAGYISNIENGYSWPSVEMLFEICEYLKVSPCEFFSYTQSNKQGWSYFKPIFEKLDPDEKELIIALINKLV